MTPLRQRFIEDMQLRNLAPTTQRSYVHYVYPSGKPIFRGLRFRAILLSVANVCWMCAHASEGN